MSDPNQIPRGADLTEADIALIADDARVVCLWCMRHKMKREQWVDEIRKAIEARLGRRPLVVDGEAA